MVSSTIIFNRSNDCISAFSSRYVGSLIFLPTDFAHDCFSFRSAAVFAVYILIQAHFININDAICRYLGYFLLIVLTFFFISFFIGYCLFFRVIFIFFNADWTPGIVPLSNCSAISLRYASGVSLSISSIFSGWYFRAFLCNSRFFRLPVSEYKSFHAIIVLPDTLNTSCAVFHVFPSSMNDSTRSRYYISYAISLVYMIPLLFSSISTISTNVD